MKLVAHMSRYNGHSLTVLIKFMNDLNWVIYFYTKMVTHVSGLNSDFLNVRTKVY